MTSPSITTRMKRCRQRSTPVPAAMPLVVVAVLLLSASYSTAESSSASCHQRTLLLQQRGGGANDETDATIDNNDEVPKNDRRKSPFWNIASLFELNAEAQEGALEIPDDDLPPGRGGALVATKPRRVTFFQQLRRPVPNEETGNPMHKLLHIKDDDDEPQPVQVQVTAPKVTAPKVTALEDALVQEAVPAQEDAAAPEDAAPTDTEEADVEPAEVMEDDKEELKEELKEASDEIEALEEEELEEELETVESAVESTVENVVESTVESTVDSTVESTVETSEEAEETKQSLFSVFQKETQDKRDAEETEDQSIDTAESNDTTSDSSQLLWWTDTWSKTLDIEVVDVPPLEEEAVEDIVFEMTEEEKKEETLEHSSKFEEVEEAATTISSDAMDNAKLATDDPQVISPVELELVPEIKHEKKRKNKKKHKKPKVEVVVKEETVIEVDEADDDDDDEAGIADMGPAIVIGESRYISSGSWTLIDNVVSLGLAVHNPSLRVSRHLRSMRKAAAKVTGLHGVLSGKKIVLGQQPPEEEEELDEQDMGQIRRRLAAIERARKSVELKQKKEAEAKNPPRRGLFGRRRRPVVEEQADGEASSVPANPTVKPQPEVPTSPVMVEDEGQEERKERVREIDRLISQASERLLELACEKDELQRRPNPLYNYTTSNDKDGAHFKFGRRFNFPPDSLVEDYLDDMFANGRLVRMNHTHLWKSGVGFDDDEDESIGDDLLTPSAHANRLYKASSQRPKKRVAHDENRHENGNGGGGSWILRQSIGKGGSLGEKIGESAEVAGYKAVCSAVMSTLARAISGIHGINIMTHSDIRLTVEQVPDLPPISKNGLPRSDYAQEAIRGAMMKGRRGKKKFPQMTETSFLQRDAVVETLLSHCQISAPLLKLFPLAWQRALLANMITLITHVVSDFCDGIELQILGHSLTFAFKPITESDMIRHIGLAGKGSNHRRARPEEFEAAVRATAEDLSHELRFLDRWHERALGSGMLRAQIANLIARIVLTLTDEVLSGARMDLWAAQAGGPRVVAGLEYRTTPSYTSPQQEHVSN